MIRRKRRRSNLFAFCIKACFCLKNMIFEKKRKQKNRKEKETKMPISSNRSFSSGAFPYRKHARDFKRPWHENNYCFFRFPVDFHASLPRSSLRRGSGEIPRQVHRSVTSPPRDVHVKSFSGDDADAFDHAVKVPAIFHKLFCAPSHRGDERQACLVLPHFFFSNYVVLCAKNGSICVDGSKPQHLAGCSTDVEFTVNSESQSHEFRLF